MINRLVLIIGTIIFGSLCGSARSIRFGESRQVSAGLPAPKFVATGDFNQDGFLDLVVSNHLNRLAVLLGNGDGTFKHPNKYTLNFYVQGQVGVGDFNGDGMADLAVEGGVRDENLGLAVLFGNGDGTFAAPIYSDNLLEGSAISLAVGDLNNDGILDIFLGGNGASADSFGKSGGRFENGETFSFAGFGVALADFNHDNLLDVAATGGHYQGLDIMLGNGDGTFRTPTTYHVGNWADAISVADFDRDGNLDIAVTDAQNTIILVFLGDGTGAFSAGQFWYVGFGPAGLATADFNHDGIPDLATGVHKAKRVSVLQGVGDGTFSWLKFPVGNGPSFLAAGDFNADHSQDLVVTNRGDNTLSILLNASGTTIQLASSLNPSKLGEAVTFTAQVSPTVDMANIPNGTMTFKDGADILGRVVLDHGNGAFMTSNLTKGKHRIRAEYSGDKHFNPNRSPVVVQEVQ